MFRALFGRKPDRASDGAARSSSETPERDKFSLGHLLDLHSSLSRIRALPPTHANDDAIVDSVRQISEIMVHGDKDSTSAGDAIFEFFCEKAILRTFVLIFRERSSPVKVQIIQTLSILLMNISNPRSLFYMLSNNHVNDLISSRVDPADEELLAYYVSFLKTLSLSVTPDTVQFFFSAGQAASELVEQATGRGVSRSFSSSTPGASPRKGGRRGSVPGYQPGDTTSSHGGSALLDSGAAVTGRSAASDVSRRRDPPAPSEEPISAASFAALRLSSMTAADARASAVAALAATASSSFAASTFPLYTEAIRFVHHGDSMVRTAARTITLNVFNVRDVGVRGFLAFGPHAMFPVQLAVQLRSTVLRMNGTLRAIRRMWGDEDASEGAAAAAMRPDAAPAAAAGAEALGALGARGSVPAHAAAGGPRGFAPVLPLARARITSAAVLAHATVTPSSAAGASLLLSPSQSEGGAGRPFGSALPTSPASTTLPFRLGSTGSKGQASDSSSSSADLSTQLSEQMSELVTYLMYLQDVLAVAQGEWAGIAAAAAVVGVPVPAERCSGDGAGAPRNGFSPPPIVAEPLSFSTLRGRAGAAASGNPAYPSCPGAAGHCHCDDGCPPSSMPAAPSLSTLLGAPPSPATAAAAAALANDPSSSGAAALGTFSRFSTRLAHCILRCVVVPLLLHTISCAAYPPSIRVPLILSSSGSGGSGSSFRGASRRVPDGAAPTNPSAAGSGGGGVNNRPHRQRGTRPAPGPPSAQPDAVRQSFNAAADSALPGDGLLPHSALHSARTGGSGSGAVDLDASFATAESASLRGLEDGADSDSDDVLGALSAASFGGPSAPHDKNENTNAAVGCPLRDVTDSHPLEDASTDSGARPSHRRRQQDLTDATSTAAVAAASASHARFGRHLTEAQALPALSFSAQQDPSSAPPSMPSGRAFAAAAAVGVPLGGSPARRTAHPPPPSTSATAATPDYFAQTSGSPAPAQSPYPVSQPPVGGGGTAGAAAAPSDSSVGEPRVPSAYTTPLVIDPGLALAVLGHVTRVLTFPPLVAALSDLLLRARLPLPSPVLGECAEGPLLAALSSPAATRRRGWMRGAAAAEGEGGVEKAVADDPFHGGSAGSARAVEAPPRPPAPSRYTLCDVLFAMAASPEHRLVTLSLGALHAMSLAWGSPTQGEQGPQQQQQHLLRCPGAGSHHSDVSATSDLLRLMRQAGLVPLRLLLRSRRHLRGALCVPDAAAGATVGACTCGGCGLAQQRGSARPRTRDSLFAAHTGTAHRHHQPTSGDLTDDAGTATAANGNAVAGTGAAMASVPFAAAPGSGGQGGRHPVCAPSRRPPAVTLAGWEDLSPLHGGDPGHGAASRGDGQQELELACTTHTGAAAAAAAAGGRAHSSAGVVVAPDLRCGRASEDDHPAGGGSSRGRRSSTSDAAAGGPLRYEAGEDASAAAWRLGRQGRVDEERRRRLHLLLREEGEPPAFDSPPGEGGRSSAPAPRPSGGSAPWPGAPGSMPHIGLPGGIRAWRTAPRAGSPIDRGLPSAVSAAISGLGRSDCHISDRARHSPVPPLLPRRRGPASWGGGAGASPAHRRSGSFAPAAASRAFLGGGFTVQGSRHACPEETVPPFSAGWPGPVGDRPRCPCDSEHHHPHPSAAAPTPAESADAELLRCRSLLDATIHRVVTLALLRCPVLPGHAFRAASALLLHLCVTDPQLSCAQGPDPRAAPTAAAAAVAAPFPPFSPSTGAALHGAIHSLGAAVAARVEAARARDPANQLGPLLHILEDSAEGELTLKGGVLGPLAVATVVCAAAAAAAAAETPLGGGGGTAGKAGACSSYHGSPNGSGGSPNGGGAGGRGGGTGGAEDCAAVVSRWEAESEEAEGAQTRGMGRDGGGEPRRWGGRRRSSLILACRQSCLPFLDACPPPLKVLDDVSVLAPWGNSCSGSGASTAYAPALGALLQQQLGAGQGGGHRAVAPAAGPFAVAAGGRGTAPAPEPDFVESVMQLLWLRSLTAALRPGPLLAVAGVSALGMLVPGGIGGAAAQGGGWEEPLLAAVAALLPPRPDGAASMAPPPSVGLALFAPSSSVASSPAALPPRRPGTPLDPAAAARNPSGAPAPPLPATLLPFVQWDGSELTLDPLLRLLSPPLDSIRPGAAFNLSRLPWFAATAYPTVLQLPAPPVGPPSSAPASSPHSAGDVLAPISLALGSATRVGVVLGQSYLVLAELLLPQPQKYPSAPQAEASAASSGQPQQRARALTVAPLHFTYTTIPPRAPHVVDVRTLTRARMPLARVVATIVEEGGRPLEVAGLTLVMDNADLASHTAAHVESARRKKIEAMVLAARLLGRSG